MKTLPKKDEKNWSKIGIIVLGIGFALLFIGTYVLSILTGSVFAPAVKAGDSVTIDLTLRDNLGRPIITTNQPLYSNAIHNGSPVFFIQPITIFAKGSVNGTFTEINAFNPVSGSWVNFGMLRPEMDLISSDLVGMHAGETKTIDLSTLFSSSSSVLSKEEYEQLIGNYTQAEVGQMFPVQLAEQPSIDLDPSNPSAHYFRIAEILDKTEENVTISYLYSSAEVTVVSTNAK
jgi:hypothetical protein